MTGSWNKPWTKDIDDWIDEAVEAGKDRRCPRCSGPDVKIAVHAKPPTLSFHCNECGHGAVGDKVTDAERLVQEWFAVPAAE